MNISKNAKCLSIGLVLALSNCSESGGDPDAMLDIHHQGAPIDTHHQPFHNSYGNINNSINNTNILYCLSKLIIL